MSNGWTKNDIPDLTGKRVVITGGNSGIGFEAAHVLAERGAEVILASRNKGRAEAAVSKLSSVLPNTRISVMELNLSDLASVRAFATELCGAYPSLDILINNAGIMMPPYGRTKDGFEAQFGTNHLGHFALTGLLLNLLKKTADSRAVTISSLAAHNATIYFDNLDGSKWYKPYKFYGQSKLANMLFGKELDYKFKEYGLAVRSIVCHPGITHTNLASRNSGKDMNRLFQFISGAFTQPTEMGALPTLYAATEPGLSGGEYIGPDGKKKRRGNPMIDPVIDRIFDKEAASRLWSVSEDLTGITFDFS
ncbi:SDR family NAD(P)-dependent oxidoreductase [Neobacillus notoginsengisoli]|uniref:SDR family NAD(P)-dependent oxidoreductase n=1 Tax=Neobacillus notoginsengisoli TaxID=1578198 RepID=A0A417YWU6_9BACI|nr:oxidoreductase [Neobacillus notoginsengisoli]RHW42063.1 SDR family NAD(P)-dependent oxidoreductase [Neobacillus notoginsengisoli]